MQECLHCALHVQISAPNVLQSLMSTSNLRDDRLSTRQASHQAMTQVLSSLPLPHLRSEGRCHAQTKQHCTCEVLKPKKIKTQNLTVIQCSTTRSRVTNNIKHCTYPPPPHSTPVVTLTTCGCSLSTCIGNFQPFVSFRKQSLCIYESSCPDNQVALHVQVQDSFQSDFALRSQISFLSDENHYCHVCARFSCGVCALTSAAACWCGRSACE